MTTQILSESWALASGSRYWTGVCWGDEGAGWGHLSYPRHCFTQVFPPAALWLGRHRDMGETSLFPGLPRPTLEPGKAAWLPGPHFPTWETQAENSVHL